MHPQHLSFRDTWRGRAFTAFSLASALALASPWLSHWTRPNVEMFSAAAQMAFGKGDVPVATVLIDEDEYTQRFAATSPLDRAELAKFFSLFNPDAPARLPAVIGIDLDLAPANSHDVDSPARQILDAALDTLADRVPLVLVWPEMSAACRDNPRATRCSMTCQWIAQRQQHGIRFASPQLDDRSSTFNRSEATLGVEMADAARTANAAFQSAPPDDAIGVRLRAWVRARVHDWFGKPPPTLQRASPCAVSAAPGLAPQAEHALHGPRVLPELLLRLGPLLRFKLADMEQAERRDWLAGFMVVVGGAYDSRDRLLPGGWNEAVPSARVHAWVAASAARPYLQLVEAAMLAIEVATGVLASAIFHAIWVRVGRSGVHFAWLSLWCLLFALSAAAPPLLLLAFAIDLHDWGLDATRLSLLVVAMEIETIVSSQEMLIHQAQSTAAAPERPNALDRGFEVIWALLQWYVIVRYLMHHGAELPGPQIPAIGVLAAGCYLWPGGPLTWVGNAAAAAWRRLRP